jgi:hypothetical protein
MELHQVRYFLALCEEQNFTRAAKRCGISQPSLSNAIKRLEEELGGPLFYRNRVGCSLSELGLELRPHLAKLNETVTDVRARATRFRTAPRTPAGELHWPPSAHRPEQSAKGMPSRVPTATSFRGLATGGTVMRAHHIIAVVAVILVGAGLKIFLSAPTADANPSVGKNVGPNIAQLHEGKSPPVEKFHDLSVVFSQP